MLDPPLLTRCRGSLPPSVRRAVVHYQLPASTDTYIHRCGRTARGAGAEGVALALVVPGEAARFGALCRAMGREGPPPDFPIDKTLMPQVSRGWWWWWWWWCWCWCWC